MSDSTRKMVSLSESTRANSSKMVTCPKCKGGDKDCKTCFGVGEITMKKKDRLNGKD